VTTMFERYAKIQEEIARLREEMVAIEHAIREEVMFTGAMVAGNGYKAYWKAGGNTTDHELAARERLAEPDFDTLYNRHTTVTAKGNLALVSIEKLKEVVGNDGVSTSTAWAKITKDGRVDVKPYTTQKDAVFVIEEV
jgi:hypothetical protein